MSGRPDINLDTDDVIKATGAVDGWDASRPAPPDQSKGPEPSLNASVQLWLKTMMERERRENERFQVTGKPVS